MIETAIHIAKRSTNKTHKTGAVIIRNGVVLATGWSHVSEANYTRLRSIHAEMHAIARAKAQRKMLAGSNIYIATINAKSGNVVNSCPCINCAIALLREGLWARYTQKHKNGGWSTEVLQISLDHDLTQLKAYPAP